MNILASLFVAATIAVDPVFTNHNSVVGSTPTMTNIQAWAAAVKTAVEQGGGGGGGESASSVTNIAMSTVTNTTQFSGYKDGSIVGRIVALENGGGGGCGGKVLRLTDSENIPANCYRGALCLEELYTDASVAMGFQSKSFAYLPNLKKVVIGKLWNSATPIANDAFKNCPIEHLVVSNNSYSTFVLNNYGNVKSSLVRIDAPAATSVKWGGAFFDCTNLKEVLLPNCTQIGSSDPNFPVFLRCLQLTNVVCTSNLTLLGSGTFSGCSSLVSVGDMSNARPNGNMRDTFYGCAKLESVNFSTNMTRIGYGMFSRCASLKSLGDLNGITSADYNSFVGCHSLKTIGDMTNCVSFGGVNFDCNNLESIGDLSSLTSLGYSAFHNTPKLRSLTFRNKTHTEVESITNFNYFPNRGTNCVFHCSDGDFYRSGSSLLPIP